MKERPILFSGPMVNAIIEGRKTQTRRVVPDDWWRCLDWDDEDDRSRAASIGPFGQPGDRLWVREAVRWEGGPRAIYEADNSACVIDTWPWKRPRLPGMFLPRGGSRITLEVTEVRVQRLQEISEDDARADGVTPFRHDPEGDCWTDGKHRTAFEYLWNELHGWNPNAWQANPWVWAITFRGLP